MPRPSDPTARRRAAQPVPRLPHPSWGRQDGNAARRPMAVTATEFWHRLGL